MNDAANFDASAPVIALAQDICAFIERGGADEAAFDALALRLFAYQYKNNAPYRRFCDGKKTTPDTVSSWRAIPPAPAQAFKRYALSCAPNDACTTERGGRIFHSSGTTSGETSRHFLDSAAVTVYEASLRKGYKIGVPRGTNRHIGFDASAARSSPFVAVVHA